MVQLLSNSESLSLFAFSSGHLPDEHTSETIKKLSHYVGLFRMEVVQSLEEVVFNFSLKHFVWNFTKILCFSETSPVITDFRIRTSKNGAGID